MYQGECGQLTCVGGNDNFCGTRSQFTWFAGAGEEYYIWISGSGTATGNYEMTLTCLQPEPNDLCEDALPLSCDVTISGSTELSTTRDNPDRDCDGQFGDTVLSVGVWYTLVGTGGDIVLSTCGTADYDTKIAIYTGECGNLECITGNDDASGCSGFTSEVTLSSEEGVTYYIFLTGYSSGSSGNYTLSVDCLCAPTSDAPECVTIYDGYDPASSTTLTGELLYAEGTVNYVWSGNTTPVAGDPSSVTVDAAAGSQNVSVTMTDSEGCTGTQEWFVYVMDINCDTRGTDKVEVCHNGTTICVAPSAVEAHLQHGDVLGACGNALCDGVAPECDAVVTSPADGAVDVELITTISWNEPTGLPDGYVVSVVDANNVEIVNETVTEGTSLDVVLNDYDALHTITVTPYNENGSAINCQTSSFTTESDPSIIQCDGSVSTFTYCYTANDNNSFYYQSADGTALTLEFLQGYIENDTWDDLIIYEGSDSSGPILWENGGSTINDLGGTVVTALSGQIFMTIDSDGIVQCDGSFSQESRTWIYEVYCGEPVISCDVTTNGSLTVTIDTDTFGSETSWNITDSSSSIVAAGSGYGSNTINTIPVNLADGTYTFTINDSWGDGIFAPSGYSVIDSNGTVVVSDFSNSFGTSASSDFCVEGTARPGNTDIKDAGTNEVIGWTMSPNPTRGNVNLDLTNYLRSNVSIQVVDFTGKVISTRQLDNLQSARYTLELSSSLPSGMYFVQVSSAESTSAKKLVIMR